MIAQIKKWIFDEKIKCHYTLIAVPTPDPSIGEMLASIGSVGERKERPLISGTEMGIQIETTVFHPKSSKGKSVDLHLTVEDATQLLVALRDCLRDARQ